MFRGEAWFQHAEFKDDIDFRATHFASEANFDDAKFEKSADLCARQGVAYFKPEQNGGRWGRISQRQF